MLVKGAPDQSYDAMLFPSVTKPVSAMMINMCNTNVLSFSKGEFYNLYLLFILWSSGFPGVHDPCNL